MVQISRGAERLRKALDPSRLTRRAEGLMKSLVEWPQRLERERRFGRVEPAAPANAGSPGPRAADPNGTSLAVGLLLVATLLLWFLRFPALLGPWTAPAQALTLVVLGLWLLRSIWNE